MSRLRLLIPLPSLSPRPVGDRTGARAILLTQIQDLVDDFGWRGLRRAMRRSRLIARSRFAVAAKASLPLVEGLARDSKVAAGLRHRPALGRGVLQRHERRA